MPLRVDRDRTLSCARFTWSRVLGDKCFETAGALSYTTLVSLVPLTVAVFAILSAFPVFAEWRGSIADYAFRYFVPATGAQIQEYMLGFASNASQLTGISVLVMLFSAVSMMISIEDRLNRIWRVRKPRGWTSHLLLYWAALTLGPVLVVGGLVLSSYLTALPMLHAAADQLATQGGLLSGAVDLSEGGLAQALTDGCLRFGTGARVWIDEIISRDGVDAAAALFSESQGRVIVTVPREEDVKFRGLCEGRDYPVLKIGVTDGQGADAAIELQDRFTLPLTELRSAWSATLPDRFGQVIAE